MKLLNKKEITVVDKLNQLARLSFIDYKEYRSIYALDTIVGDIQYTYQNGTLDVVVRILRKYQQLGLASKALILLVEEYKIDQKGGKIVLREENLKQNGEYLLESFEFHEEDDLFIREITPKNSEEEKVIADDNKRYEEVILGFKEVGTYLEQLKDEVIQERDDVLIFLKLLSNVDPFTVKEENVDSLMNKLIGLKDPDTDLYHNISKIAYYHAFLSEDEQTRLRWLVLNFADFNVLYYLAAELYQRAKLVDKVFELEGVFQKGLEGEMTFNPYNAFGTTMYFIKYSSDREYYMYLPDLQEARMKSIIQNDDIDQFVKFYNAYELEVNFYDQEDVDLYIDSAFKNKARNIIDYLPKIDNLFYENVEGSLYLMNSIMYNAIQSGDFEFVKNVHNEFIGNNCSLSTFVVCAMNQSKEFISLFDSNERVDVENVMNIFSIHTINENLENLDYILTMFDIDLNYVFEENTLFQHFMESGSKQAIDIAIKHGGDLYTVLLKEKELEDMKIYVYQKACFNTLETMKYVMDLVDDTTYLSNSLLLETSLHSNDVESAYYILNKYPNDEHKTILKDNAKRYAYSLIRKKRYNTLFFVFKLYLSPNTVIDKFSLFHHAIIENDNYILDFCFGSKNLILDANIKDGVKPMLLAITANNVYAVKELHKRGVTVKTEDYRSVKVSKKEKPEMYATVKEITGRFDRMKDVLEIIGYILLGLIAIGVLVILFSEMSLAQFIRILF